MATLQLLIFRIPGIFHMGYAPLARFLRKKTGDAYRAENLFILAAASLIIVLMLANQIAWAFVRDEVLQDPRGATAVVFWLTQLAFGILFVVTCVIGFKPPVTITCTRSSVNIQDGVDHFSIPYSEIEDIRVIPAKQYHGHYRLYKATRSIVNRIDQEQVMIRTAGTPIILGLPSVEIPAFVRQIEDQRVSTFEDLPLQEALLA